MSKRRTKPTNNELVQMIQVTNSRLVQTGQSINTVGQTLSDFIEFNNQEEQFLTFLKEKYKPEESKEEDNEKKKEE